MFSITSGACSPLMWYRMLISAPTVSPSFDGRDSSCSMLTVFVGTLITFWVNGMTVRTPGSSGSYLILPRVCLTPTWPGRTTVHDERTRRPATPQQTDGMLVATLFDVIA